MTEPRTTQSQSAVARQPLRRRAAQPLPHHERARDGRLWHGLHLLGHPPAAPRGHQALPLAGSGASSTLGEALAEARTSSLLAHPNIVTVFDFEVDGPYAYLVMEYVDGLNLAELLARVEGGTLTHDEAACLVQSVASALGYAHENGVLHMDIKPTNIMIDRTGTVKLCDFGMATLASAAGYGGARGGTVGYMPPEQIEGDLVDERTDVFSLAVVVWQALLGASPFAAPHPRSRSRSSERVQASPPSRTPAWRAWPRRPYSGRWPPTPPRASRRWRRWPRSSCSRWATQPLAPSRCERLAVCWPARRSLSRRPPRRGRGGIVRRRWHGRSGRPRLGCSLARRLLRRRGSSVAPHASLLLAIVMAVALLAWWATCGRRATCRRGVAAARLPGSPIAGIAVAGYALTRTGRACSPRVWLVSGAHLARCRRLGLCAQRHGRRAARAAGFGLHAAGARRLYGLGGHLLGHYLAGHLNDSRRRGPGAGMRHARRLSAPRRTDGEWRHMGRPVMGEHGHCGSLMCACVHGMRPSWSAHHGR